jgi:hypothetical protein
MINKKDKREYLVSFVTTYDCHRILSITVEESSDKDDKNRIIAFLRCQYKADPTSVVIEDNVEQVQLGKTSVTISKKL